MNKKKSTPWLQVLHVVMPLCIGYIPVGLACKVLLQEVGFDFLLSGLSSILVFSNGVRFLVASILTAQTSFATTLLMVFFLELRYTLLGIGLAGFMKKEKRMSLAVFPQSLNDKNCAANYLKFSTDPSWNKRKALYVNWFSMAARVDSSMIGNFSDSMIRVDADLVYLALTTVFILMFVVRMKNTLLIFTGLFSGVLGVVFMVLFQSIFGLVAATVIASFAGFMLEKAFKKGKTKKLRDRDRDANEPLFNFPEQEADHYD